MENLGGLQERYWQQHNYSKGFQHPTVKNGEIFQTKYQQGYSALNNAQDQMELTDIHRAFIPKKQNTHSFQMHMEHFQR